MLHAESPGRATRRHSRFTTVPRAHPHTLSHMISLNHENRPSSRDCAHPTRALGPRARALSPPGRRPAATARCGPPPPRGSAGHRWLLLPVWSGHYDAASLLRHTAGVGTRSRTRALAASLPRNVSPAGPSSRTARALKTGVPAGVEDPALVNCTVVPARSSAARANLRDAQSCRRGVCLPSCPLRSLPCVCSIPAPLLSVAPLGRAWERRPFRWSPPP